MPLNAPAKEINLENCILCQKKRKLSDWLSSGETGRDSIVSLAQQTKSNDTWADRVLRLTVQEQGRMKYHTSSCYRQFQRDMETEGYRAKSITHPLEQSQSSQQETSNNTSERCSKRFKSSVTKNVCIICGVDIKTVLTEENPHIMQNL